MSTDDGTRLIDIGGGLVGVLYPEVYTKFIQKLYREHDDLVRGMVLAKVNIRDGSARDYLNLMLGTEVQANTPMEIGYAQWYDALDRRVSTRISEQKIKHTADAYHEHQMWNKHDGPLFPELPDQ